MVHTAKMSATRRLTMLAMFSALAYVVMAVGRIKVISFLSYDPKDVIIAFAGLLYGPLPAFVVTSIVGLVEMITVSDTGPIGLIMNVLATTSFVCPVAILYRRERTLRNAIKGLLIGVLLMTGVMLLWNYLITPMYMGVEREQVAGMLTTVFLPFNLLKGGINATLTLLLYKPLMRALRAASLIPPQENAPAASKGLSTGVVLVSAGILVTCILIVLVMKGML